MGIFNGKKSISQSPEIDVKPQSLIKSGWWITKRLPKPSRSEQPHLSESSHSINSASSFQGSAGTYRQASHSDYAHQNAAEAFADGAGGQTYRTASRTHSVSAEDAYRYGGSTYRTATRTHSVSAEDAYRYGGGTYRNAQRTNSYHVNAEDAYRRGDRTYSTAQRGHSFSLA